MLQNIKLGGKLTASFLAVILCTATIGYLGNRGLQEVGGLVAKADALNRVVQGILEARRHEKNFIIRKELSYIPKVEEQVGIITNQLKEIGEKSQGQNDKEWLQKIGKQVDDYSKAFSAYVTLENQRSKTMDEIRATSDQTLALVETMRESQKRLVDELPKGATISLDKVQELVGKTEETGSLSRRFIEARKNEKELLLSGDLKFHALVNEELEQIFTVATKIANNAPTPAAKEVSEKFLSGIRGYQKLFGQYHDLMRKQVEVDKQLVATARETQKICEEVRQEEHAHMGRELKRLGVVLLLGTLAAVGLGIGLALLITRSITRPVHKTMLMLQELGKGHITHRLRLAGGDEISQMAKTMDTFADSLQSELVAGLEKLAHGDLTFTAIPKDGEDVLGQALQKTFIDLNRLLGEIISAAEQINAGAGQVADASQALSQGATEQAAAMEEITSSMTEMSSQIRTTAENANHAKGLTDATRTAAARGNEQMTEMVTAMAAINEAGLNISKIIKVIDEIAFQTNLLALNAAVEAARAGRHGKGFAVVAEEVRNLAARSAKAAKETAELIEGAVGKSEAGSAIANRTAQALGEIVTEIGKVNDLVGEIASASNEQAAGIAQVNQGLTQIDQVTQQNTAHAEQGAAAAEELSAQAAHLQELTATFTLKREGSRNYRPHPTPPRTHSGQTGGRRSAPHHLLPPSPSDIITLDDQEYEKF